MPSSRGLWEPGGGGGKPWLGTSVKSREPAAAEWQRELETLTPTRARAHTHNLVSPEALSATAREGLRPLTRGSPSEWPKLLVRLQTHGLIPEHCT